MLTLSEAPGRAPLRWRQHDGLLTRGLVSISLVAVAEVVDGGRLTSDRVVAHPLDAGLDDDPPIEVHDHAIAARLGSDDRFDLAFGQYAMPSNPQSDEGGQCVNPRHRQATKPARD
jgi:hypothetical protein